MVNLLVSFLILVISMKLKQVLHLLQMVILRQNLPGYDAISPYDLVLSPQDGLLYWSDAKRNVISGMHLDGTNIGVIINDSLQKPRHLAVASESR